MEHKTFGAALFDSIRGSGITRPSQRWFGGVASGYASLMNVSPLLVRAGFIVLGIFGGLGLILYGFSWMLLPESDDGRIHLQEAFSGRFDGALALAAAITVTGILVSGSILGALSNTFAGAAVISGSVGILVAVILAILLTRHLIRRRRRHARPAPSVSPGGTALDIDSPQLGSAVDPLAVTSSAGDARRENASRPPDVRGMWDGNPVENLPDSDLGGASTEPVSTPPVYMKAPPPSRRRAPGPGARATSLSFAVVLLAAAGVLAAWQRDIFAMSFPLIAIIGFALVGIGLVIAVLGVMGRRAGAINLLAVLAVFAGGITGAMSFDRNASEVLALDTAQATVNNFDIHVTSVEQLEDLDWDLPATTQWVHLFIDIPSPSPSSTVEIDLPPGVSIDFAFRSDLAFDLQVAGQDAQIYGDFNSGQLETNRTIGNRSEGFSIANGGELRLVNHPARTPLILKVNAAGSSVTFHERSDS